MSAAGVTEQPLVYECEGTSCVAILHRPAQTTSIGVVIVIAGGPQYRAGVGRGMVSLARYLVEQGIAVLRFDFRGLGDTGGEFEGFEHYRADLQAAVDTLRREVSAVERVVLWGGCDAASGAMIHGHRIEGVTALGLGNPWVTTPETQAVVQREHYRNRLLQWSFWRKLLRMEYNLMDYAREAWSALARRLRPAGSVGDSGDEGDFVQRMQRGLASFDGPVLFVISGQSMLSREFDELVSRDPGWAAAYGRDNCQRVDFPDADQTFSDSDSRAALNRALADWVHQLGNG